MLQYILRGQISQYLQDAYFRVLSKGAEYVANTDRFCRLPYVSARLLRTTDHMSSNDMCTRYRLETN